MQFQKPKTDFLKQASFLLLGFLIIHSSQRILEKYLKIIKEGQLRKKKKIEANVRQLYCWCSGSLKEKEKLFTNFRY